MRSRLLKSAALAMSSLLSLGACLDEPFLRDNPLDADADVVVEITGVPDTVFSRGGSFIASVSSSVPLPVGTEVTWRGVGVAAFPSGQVVATGAGFTPRTVSVFATLGPAENPREVRRDFIDMQRPFSTELSCNPTCNVLGLGQLILLNFRAIDSLGTVVAGYPYAPPGDSLVVRDTSVLYDLDTLDAGTLRVRARAVGQTWFVWRSARSRILTDSMLITVEQRPTQVHVSNCDMWIHAPDSTGQIQVAAITDGNGTPIPQPWPEIQWTPGESLNGTGTIAVSPSGAIMVLQRDVTWYTTAYATAYPNVAIGGCRIYAP
jgi:hypothetical protein